MSVKAMTFAWEADLKPREKLVLLAIADHADGSGVCWPGQEHIAEKCGLHRVTVNRIINQLIDLDYMSIKKRRGQDGRQATSIYKINLLRKNENPELQTATLEMPENENPELQTATLEMPENENPELQFEQSRVAVCTVQSSGLYNYLIIEPSRTVNRTVRKDTRTRDVVEKNSEKKTPEKILAAFGISGQLASDFLAVRKAKKIPLTQTAMEGIFDEAVKAGLSVVEAVTISTQRGWAGFRASWDWQQTSSGHIDQQPRASPKYVPPDQRNSTLFYGKVIDSTAKKL